MGVLLNRGWKQMWGCFQPVYCLCMVGSPKCVSCCSSCTSKWFVRMSQSLLSLHMYDCYSVNTMKRAIEEMIWTPSRVPVPFVCTHGKLNPVFHQISRKASSDISNNYSKGLLENQWIHAYTHSQLTALNISWWIVCSSWCVRTLSSIGKLRLRGWIVVYLWSWLK